MRHFALASGLVAMLMVGAAVLVLADPAFANAPSTTTDVLHLGPRTVRLDNLNIAKGRLSC